MQENLKEILERIVADLKSQGIDLQSTPALFTWRYPESETVQYQLLIKVSSPAEDDGGGKYVH